MRMHRLATGGAAALVAATLGLTSPASAVPAPDAAARQEQYRPQLHYTPAQNWMNDPNGLVFYQGEYHLFYQYNPEGAQWGNMSWGHAVSRDLLHWEELPVAIPYSEREHIFSGGIVVDEQNTSGFGTTGNPPMVAVYTSWDPVTGIQAQSLAYSTDRGRTWTKYDGNPVLDIGSRDFRDPKVFWYDDGGYWVMSVVLATEHKVQFYRSADLKRWTHLSDFGPANATGGVWEVPDLFELPVDGDPNDTRWVLVVNLNPGAVAGGSGAQYFLGDFDGTTFTADNVVDEHPVPSGTVFEDFESGDYAGWTVHNDPDRLPGPFGEAPATGTLDGQLPVSGYLGERLVNSFVGHDGPRGSMVSREFRITEDFVNLLVGGGNHPWQEGTSGSPEPVVPEGGTVLQDFEFATTFESEGWTATGGLADRAPATGALGGQQEVTGFQGERLVNTFYEGDSTTGTLTSPEFQVTSDYLNFLVGGGRHPLGDPSGATVVNLLVGGEIVRSATGAESEHLNWTGWDVREFAGRTAQIQVVDQNPGGWGHILLDHVVAADQPVLPASTETAVNLVVDGQVVRTATGANSEVLDWQSWDVRDLKGKQARIHVNDFNSGGWGHINVDHIMFGDEPARPRIANYDWLDWGKDFYAAVSYENVPGDKRIWTAWMSNWNYAGAVPTDPWRGAQALPREVSLKTVDGEVRVVQEPVQQVRSLRGGPAYQLRNRTIGEGVTDLPDRADGTVQEIEAEFELGSAERFGLHVRGGAGQRTVVGYDVAAGQLFVDRTHSGQVAFHPDFPGVHTGPLSVQDGRVTMTLYVDRSSVEVFGGFGETVITDLIFPDLTSDEVSLWAEGGDVTVRRLSVRPLRSVWR